MKVDTADIYRTGQCTSTDSPLFHTRTKYRPYSEIWLFRPVSGYRTDTFSPATLNFYVSLPPIYHTNDDKIPIGGEERHQ